MEIRRVLITASREWEDRDAVFDVLFGEMAHGPIIIVHGDCPTGGDADAQAFHLKYWRQGAGVERHPAKWRDCLPSCYHKPRYRRDGTLYCPAAGNYRNQEMVDLGADVCHGFPLRQSKGTWHCMNAAEKADILVINHGFGGEKWKAAQSQLTLI